jgi:hypothetical protein
LCRSSTIIQLFNWKKDKSTLYFVKPRSLSKTKNIGVCEQRARTLMA